jgi:predicted enzyme related to lactoylglutathione lyase
MPSDTPRGRFVWHDLMTTEPDRAKSFYTGVADWGTQDWNQTGTPYTMWTARDTPVGGLMKLPEEMAKTGAPPHWLAYVSTPDVDATVKRAVTLGGRVMTPAMDIPTVGRFAVLTDPQGAAFAVFSPLEDAPADDGDPKPGEFSWHELVTTDHVKAFDFYSDLFGWEKMQSHDMGPLGIYQIFGRKGRQLGGMYNKPADMPAPPNWMVYVLVDDVAKTSERVKKLGGKVVNGPMEVPGGSWIAQCVDPQGGHFAVHSMEGPRAD